MTCVNNKRDFRPLKLFQTEVFRRVWKISNEVKPGRRALSWKKTKQTKTNLTCLVLYQLAEAT